MLFLLFIPVYTGFVTTEKQHKKCRKVTYLPILATMRETPILFDNQPNSKEHLKIMTNLLSSYLTFQEG
jgi:hypothetical protein